MSNIKGHLFLNEISQPVLFIKDDVKNSIELTQGRLSVLGSGMPNTFCFDVSKNGDWSWIVCGIGIIDAARFVEKDEWGKILREDNVRPDKLDGHWIILRWKDDVTEFYNDPLELRKLYWKKEKNKILFATQLTDIADMAECPEFSFEDYAGSLRFQYSFGDGALLKGVKRLGTAGFLKIQNDKITHKTTQWTLTAEQSSEGSLIDTLKSITNIKIPCLKKPTLCLSGGIDSRTVLSLFDELPDFENFGRVEDADVQIAKIIGNKLGKDINFLEYKTPKNAAEKNIAFENMRNAALFQTSFLHTNISDLLEKRNKEKYWLIDGGLGEAMRLGFGRKLLMSGVGKLWEKGDFSSFEKYMYKTKFDIFNRQLRKNMDISSEREFISAVDKMPKNISFIDWIYLIHIRYVIKNLPVNSQGLYDSMIVSYMPLIQPSVLRCLQSMPVKERMNCRINRKIIHKFQPILSTVPLAWFGAKVPFVMSENIVSAKLYSIIYNKFRKPQQSYIDDVMFSLKELVLDRINSNAVRECGWYDIESIKDFAEIFYSGRCKNSQFLFDWLQIDFWRERIK